MSAAKVLLAVACVLATVSFGVEAQNAQLTFVATNGAVGVKAMTPTSFRIMLGTDAQFGATGNDLNPGGPGNEDGLEAGDRLEIHLPGFGGAYNSFGARHEAALPSAGVGAFNTPQQNGIYGLDLAEGFLVDAFIAAEWDAAREVLKLTVNALNTVRGVYVDHNFLRLENSPTGLPSGLGPLPPNGGIDSNWYKMAWVRWYNHDVATGLCTGGSVANVGLGADTCKFDLLTALDSKLVEEFAWSAAQVPFVTGNSRMSTQRIGAAGTAVGPTFSLLKAKGTNTGFGSSNCMTITMTANVALVTTDKDAVTAVTLHGLTGSSTASTEALPIYLGDQCSTVPAVRTANANIPLRTVPATNTDVFIVAGASVSTDTTVATRLDTTDLFVSTASPKKTWQADWNKDEGTVMFEIGEGRSISAGETVVFSIELVNGDTTQDSRAVSASVNGYYCKSNLCDKTSHQAVDIAAVPFHSASKMLQTLEPTFTTAIVSQSTTDPESTATITVSLKANQALKDDSSIITITGLCGTLTNEDVTIVAGTNTVIGTNFKAAVAWEQTTNVLKITTGSTGMEKDTTYVFTFDWLLVDTKNDVCDISIMASGTNTFISRPMDNASGKAGKVDAPEFTTYKIGQYSTRPDVENYVCVTLKANTAFKSDDSAAGENGKSIFTLSGLLGSQKNDEESTSLYSCPTKASPTPTDLTAALAATKIPFKPLTSERTAGTYDFKSGDAIFVMDSDGFVSGTEYVFAIRIKNNAAANNCQTVTLKVSGDITQTVPMELDSAAGRAIQDGETDGDVCPLKTYAPGFHTLTIAQESKLAEQANVITVTLRSNVDFSSTTNGLFADISITGLTGSDTPSSTTMLDFSSTSFITKDSVVPFGLAIGSVEWVQKTGFLRLRLTEGTSCSAPTNANGVNTCIKAGSNYVIQFALLNGDTKQTAPVVSVQMLYGTSASKNTVKQTMNAPADKKYAALAILDKTEILDKFNIGQVSAQQDKLNALCVTLRPNKDLTTQTTGAGKRFVSFTIKGLTGFQTDSQDLDIRTATTTVGGVSAGTTAVAGAAVAVTDFFGTTADASAATLNHVEFDFDLGTATFFLQEGKTMTKDTDYSFCFQVTNPEKEMACSDRTVTIAAKDSDTSTADAITFDMKQDTGMLTDYPMGSKCAGYTAPRKFTRATFRVDSNVTGYETHAIVELVTNYKLGTQKVITISGLEGFKAKTQGSTVEPVVVDLLSFTADGVHSVDLGEEGTWDGTSVLTFTTGSDSDRVGTTEATVISSYGVLDSADADRATESSEAKGDYVYVLAFKMINPATAQKAPVISIHVDTSFESHPVETGPAQMGRRSGLVPVSSRRAGSGDTMFKYVATQPIYGGESIVLDLPHYTGMDGAVFGVTSMPSDAFTTYESSNALAANGINEDKARAMFTNGFVATGSDKSQTAAVGGTLILDSDDDGYAENKENWFAEGAIWSGEVTLTAAAAITATSELYEDGKVIAYTLAADPLGTEGILETADVLAGAILSCFVGDQIQSRYILESDTTFKTVFVEQAFVTTAPTFTTEACSISFKSAVGKYTGHTVMMENGVEYMMKQGAGPFYSVSDGSGVQAAFADLDDKKYTVYSQLILTAAKGSSIAMGEEVTITIPAGIVEAPSDLTALVNEEDDNDATIAEKTTIKHQLVTTIHHPTAASATQASLKLSKTWPYAYDFENKQSFTGKYLELFGATSLLATGKISGAAGAFTITTTTSNIGANDVNAHDFSADATTAGGFGGAAVAQGMSAGATNQFWTSLADLGTVTATSALIELGHQGAENDDAADDETFGSSPTRTHTEPTSITGYDTAWAKTVANEGTAGGRQEAGNVMWLLDSLGQFLSEPVKTATEIATTPAEIAGLGTFVPQMVAEFTAPTDVEFNYGEVKIAETTAVAVNRAKSLSSSIRAAFTIVPALTIEMTMAVTECAADGSDRAAATVEAGKLTCGSALGIPVDGSLLDAFPCGVTVTIDTVEGGPSMSLPADMSATTCITVNSFTADDMTWGTEEIFSEDLSSADIKAFVWGRKWLVTESILSLDISGTAPTSAINITSSAISAVTGAPTRRRLLAVCPTGYEYRLAAVGSTFEETCACPSACGEDTATCSVAASGNWTAALVPVSACVEAEDEYDYTGAIVGGVIGGILGLLLLAAIGYYCCRQEETGPVGRPPAPEKAMVPVYLPQSYPVIPAEYTQAAPMPMSPEYQQQPQMVYPGSVQPMMMQQGYDMQPQYEMQQQQPYMIQQQQPVAYGM